MSWAGASWSSGFVVGGKRIMPGCSPYDESNGSASWYLYEDFGTWEDFSTDGANLEAINDN